MEMLRTRLTTTWKWLQADPDIDYRVGAGVVSFARISIGFLLWVRGPAFVPGMVALLLATALQVGWWWWYVKERHPITKAVAVLAIAADVVLTGVGVMFSGGTSSPAVLIWTVTLSLGGVWIGIRATLPVLGIVIAFLLGIGLGPLDMHVDPKVSAVQHGVFAAYMLTFLMMHGGVASAMHRASARALADMEAMARRDALTGLGNRLSFDDSVEGLLDHARANSLPLALAILDVDDFKAVNDNHGHIAGDAVLVALAGQIRSEVRQTDLAVRLGGEEFVVMLPNTDADAAIAIVDRIRSRFAQRPDALGSTFSAGVAVYGPDNDSPNALIEAADVALYAAKRAGKNRTVLDSLVASDAIRAPHHPPAPDTAVSERSDGG